MLLEENIEEYQNNQRVDKIFIKTKKIYLKKWQIWLHLNLKLRIQKQLQKWKVKPEHWGKFWNTYN